ncbi:hypothetical protein [Streptomyces colonosanans]|uniref:hypothetical protein n=1 Tax=Streptomyces colonosanans TaxID=1428652 RepID=UPI0008F5C530|nr:hypothetical protein [Streptomyces colonosanans]
MLRPRRHALDLEGANRHGQQLYFADTERRLQLLNPKSSRIRPEPAPQPPPPLVPAGHRQLVLFPPSGRDLRRGQERGFPDVDAPEVAAALKAAVGDYAHHHGLEYSTAWGLDRGLRVLLSIHDTPGARFLASDVLLLRDLFLPVRPLLRLLTQLDMLDDDRTPNIVPWFRERTAGLPEPMVGELTTWFELKLSGSNTAPRVKARPHRWIQRMVTKALPALQAWADQDKDSLRSITRADVVAVLPNSGTPRVDMLQGLRHILRPLKNQRVIFTDPTARIFCGMPSTTIPLPVETDDLRRILHDQEAPRAALAALAIFHALTSGQLRRLKTTDLRDGRLFLPNRTVLLAEPARTRLAAYLDYRNRRWPAPPTPTCSSPRPRAAVWSRSATSGSTTCSAYPPVGSGRTASSTRPRPPAATPAASATCSACPSAQPCATPAPSTRLASSNTTSATPDHAPEGRQECKSLWAMERYSSRAVV